MESMPRLTATFYIAAHLVAECSKFRPPAGFPESHLQSPFSHIAGGFLTMTYKLQLVVFVLHILNPSKNSYQETADLSLLTIGPEWQTLSVCEHTDWTEAQLAEPTWEQGQECIVHDVVGLNRGGVQTPWLTHRTLWGLRGCMAVGAGGFGKTECKVIEVIAHTVNTTRLVIVHLLKYSVLYPRGFFGLSLGVICCFSIA